MLKITVKLPEFYNEATQEFVWETADLELEHSLLTVSKWESEFQKPFLAAEDKSEEETIGYVRHMISTPDYSEEVFQSLIYDADNMIKVRDYIQASLTGSSIREQKNGSRSRERITSELIYYWMSDFNINWEAQNWHLSRLLMLIRIASAKRAEANAQTNGKKGPAPIKGDSLEARRAENARRKAELGTRG